MTDYSNPEVLGGIVQWCQDNVDKLTNDETAQLTAALAAAWRADADGGLVLAVDNLDPTASASLQAVARLIAENHVLIADEP